MLWVQWGPSVCPYASVPTFLWAWTQMMSVRRQPLGWLHPTPLLFGRLGPREEVTSLKTNRKQFWGRLRRGPGCPGSMPLPFPCLEGESSSAKSLGGPGLWHTADCLVLARLVAWGDTEGCRNVGNQYSSHLVAFAHLPSLHSHLCLSYVFFSVTSSGFAARAKDNPESWLYPYALRGAWHVEGTD